MIRILLCLIVMFSNIHVIAQENSPSLNLLEKGSICEIKAEYNIRELLYEGSYVTVERIMGEGDYFLKYNFHIDNCGIVSATTDDDGLVYRVSIRGRNFSTKEGARIGMTLAELKVIYPKADLIFQFDGMENTGGNYSFSIDGIGVFTIDASTILNQCGDKFPYCEGYMMDLKSIKFFTY